MSKTCKRCKTEKNDNEFAKGQVWCRKCKADYSVGYYSRPHVKARQAAHSKHHQAKSPRHGLLIRLIKALKRKPTSNPVTIDEIMEMWNRQGGKCALTNLQMVWGGDGNGNHKIRPHSVSIDRIDNNEGYTLQNVRLICHAINSFKGSMTDDEMKEMARHLIDDPISNVL